MIGQNVTEEVLEHPRPWVSLYNVDLKRFRDRPYRDLGGTLERVLWTSRALHEKRAEAPRAEAKP